MLGGRTMRFVQSAVVLGAGLLMGQLADGYLIASPKTQRYANSRSFAQYPVAKMPSSLQLQSDSEPWAEEQKNELQNILERINELENDILGWNVTDDDKEDLMEDAVRQLEQETEIALATSIPPVGLSIEDFKAAVKLFFNLNPPIRLAIVRVLGMDDVDAKLPYMIPHIVRELYEKQDTLAPKVLQESLKEALAAPAQIQMERAVDAAKDKESETLFNTIFSDDDDDQEREIATRAKGYLPRVTQREGQMPSVDDIKILTDALDNKIFSSSSRPVEIPGGYVLRGENRMVSGSDLICALDAKLPVDWNCTVSYMYDISDLSDGDIFEDNFALVLLKKDFSPVTNQIFYQAVSLVSFATILLFCVGVYGANQDVLNRLTDGTSLGDFSGVDWFNAKILEVLGPIFVILASHEFGHILAAKKDKIETTSLIPTFLPAFGSLPLFGTLTRIKSSPKNLTSLFDYAFLGPLLGFVSSFIFLGTGLVATKAALDDGTSTQYLPSLPVSVVGLSTMGGSIIDNFFAGGDGYITALDPVTAVPLHPFAVAGYCGLLINAAEMLPLGATDGGRLALTIFGRRGHSVIGGITWFALLVASFTLDDRQSQLLITAWVSNNIFQNDMEVPCRDESQNPSVPRMAAAFSMWFLATLTIIPLNTIQ